MVLDAQLRRMITAEVKAALAATMEEIEERWLTGDELIKQFGCFSKDWLKRYGHLLPRTHAAGSNRWCYPVHKINRLISEGKISNLDIYGGPEID